MRSRTPRLACLCLAAAAAALALAAAPAPSPAAASCPPQPKGFSPARGDAVARFTMLLRVNQPLNAQVYADTDEAAGGLAGRIRSNDVFLVNTRFDKGTPADWDAIVSVLRSAFPCNRIFALNGLGGDPARPGYAYALAGDPRVDGVLLDWELDDWSSSRSSVAGRARWSPAFGKARKRVSAATRTLAAKLAARGGPRARIGLAPQFLGDWHYGLLGRTLDARARRLASGPALQSVQTQDACAYRGGGGMKAVTGRLLREYKSANFKRVRRGRTSKGKPRFRHLKRRPALVRPSLGVQVSFSDSPNPAAGMAVLRTSPGTASKCTRATLKRGAGAILYWASTDSMRSLLATPRVCALRPSLACGG